MKILPFAVGQFQENAYLVIDETTSRAVFVDPGAEPDRLVAAVRGSGVTLEGIWLTHAHVDHVGGIAALTRVWPVPVFLHPADQPLYEAADLQAAAYDLPFDPPPPANRALADGDVLHVGALTFSVMHCPGHSPGHVVIHGNGVALVGDCLFAGSVGRTDLPLSDPAQLARSLRRIAALPEETVVYSGHGPATTIGRERSTNPFLNGLARVAGG